MTEEEIRHFFDLELAPPAHGIQQDARRRWRKSTRADVLAQRFVADWARPVVARLRPSWTYDHDATLAPDELFASGLFQRIPLTRFDARARLRGTADHLPFEMHEVTATGEGDRQYVRILLLGFFAHLKLPEGVPGHIRFCHQQADKAWRRPAMVGYRSLDSESLNGRYLVDGTPDGPDLAAIPHVVALMDDLAQRGWLVHLAFGGLSAWVAIERSRTWFDLRAEPPYSADDVLELEHVFATLERVASALGRLKAAPTVESV